MRNDFAGQLCRTTLLYNEMRDSILQVLKPHCTLPWASFERIMGYHFRFIGENAKKLPSVHEFVCAFCDW
jgi:hypothetical protein